MSKKETINKVVFSVVGGPYPIIRKSEEIKGSHNIVADLGADSLDVIEIVMALEEEFSTEIPDEICEKWKTVQDIYNYFEE